MEKELANDYKPYNSGRWRRLQMPSLAGVEINLTGVEGWYYQIDLL